jgi:four helix bundle protein
LLAKFGFRISEFGFTESPTSENQYRDAESLSSALDTSQMNKKEFQDRTKKLALRTARLVNHLPNSAQGQIFGRQLLRSSTSVAANYRAACRARSTAEFLSKLSIVEEEADESLFWLELITEAGLVRKELIADLLIETDEIISIIVASIRTARRRTIR